MNKTIGVYKVQNINTGKAYIGQSTDVENRYSHHKSLLNKGKHSNPELQESWNTYGESSFVFEVIQECAPEELLDLEQYWADMYEDIFNVGNNTRFPLLGKDVSAETRALISESSIKAWKDPQYKAKMATRKGMTGKTHSDETKKKLSITMSNVLKDLWKDPVYREKMMNKPKPSAETRRKIGENSRMHDPAARKAHSEKLKALRYDLNCVICEAPYVAKVKRAKYCSKDCSNQARKK